MCYFNHFAIAVIVAVVSSHAVAFVVLRLVEILQNFANGLQIILTNTRFHGLLLAAFTDRQGPRAHLYVCKYPFGSHMQASVTRVETWLSVNGSGTIISLMWLITATVMDNCSHYQ